MKESLYGWYPAASQLNDSGELQYAKAGSYRYWLAKCRKDARWAPTPERPTATRIELLARHSQQQQQQYPLQFAVPTPPTTPHSTDFAPIPDQMRTTPEKDSVNDCDGDSVVSSRKSRGKAWSTDVPQTPLFVSIDKPCGAANDGQAKSSLEVHISRPTRVKSAASSREKESFQHRRVKSAGVERAKVDDTHAARSPTFVHTKSLASDCAKSPVSDYAKSPIHERAKSAIFDSSTLSISRSASSMADVVPSKERVKSANHVRHISASTLRPKAPTPPVETPPDAAISSPTETIDSAVDFETQLKKYGWRMQVPGDPFNLKRPLIPKRHAYTVTVATPSVRPNPARAHMQNFNTYFLNTIPRRRRTFAIHDEWVSEILHAKRMELQKRDGKDYQYRCSNFSFLY